MISERFTLEQDGDRYTIRIKGDYIINIDGYTGVVTLGEGLSISENGLLTSNNSILHTERQAEVGEEVPLIEQEAFANHRPIEYLTEYTGSIVFYNSGNQGDQEYYIGFEYDQFGINRYLLIYNDVLHKITSLISI